MPVSLQNFQDSVRRLAELRSEGLARLSITPDGFITVGIDASAGNVPEPGGGLFAEIFTLLSAIAAGRSADEWIEERQEMIDDQDGVEDEDGAISRAKYAAAAEAFPAIELSRRAWHRKVSKLPVLESISWEVVSRSAHSGAAPPNEADARTPFAQLRLSAFRPASHLFQDGAQKEIVLGLDPEDVADLIRELERLTVDLQRAEGDPPALLQETTAESRPG